MAVRQIKAEDTSMVFGRGPDITDRNELVKKANGKIREYLVTSWEHDEDSDLLENQALSPGRAGVSDEINFLWGSGPFSVQVPSEDGYLDLIQALLNDPNPVSVAIPSKTLVAAATDLSDIVAATYFSDTTDVSVTVVDGENLMGAANANKAIAENLGAYPDELTLTVTPDRSADLTNSSTDATIVITYTDADGETQMLTLTFADAVKTTAQQASLPAGATLTRVRSTGWSAGTFSITAAIASNIVRNPEPDRPGQLRVKYTGTLTSHKLLIRGVRRVGLASTDTLPMREEIDLGADVLTGKYFHRINSVVVKDATGAIVAAPAGTVEIIAEPGGFETTLKAVNDDPEGLSFEVDVGGEPRVVNRGIVIDGNIEIGDTIGATYNVLSNRVDKRQTIEERDEPQFTSMMAQDRDDHPRLEDRDFERVTSRFYAGHGRFLELDGEAVICNSVGLNVEHNYDFVQGKVPGMFRRDTDANARRLTTASVNTNYESGSSEEDTFIRWDERYRNREKVNVRIGTYQWLGSGRQLSVTYRMKNCDIQSPVRVPATGPGVIPVDVELKALPLPGQTDGEIEVIIVSDDQWVA